MKRKSQSTSSSTPSADHSKTMSPIKWGGLIQGVLALFLMVQTARLALNLARWQEPVRYASIAMLLVTVGLAVYGLRGLWQWICTLTLRRALTIVAVLYLAIVSIVGLTTPNQSDLSKNWLDAAVEVPLAAVRAIAAGGVAVLRFPGQFRVAYTGRAPLLSLPGRPELEEEPVLANAPPTTGEILLPPSDETPSRRVSLGSEVVVTAQGSSVCQMHVLADGPFTAGVAVVVVEGPRFVDQETWWRVENDTGSGWCPSTVIAEVP